MRVGIGNDKFATGLTANSLQSLQDDSQQEQFQRPPFSGDITSPPLKPDEQEEVDEIPLYGMGDQENAQGRSNL